MITVRNYLEGENLWDEISQLGTFPFITSETNNMFLIYYGQSWLFSAFEETPVSDVAAMLVSVFGDKWARVMEIHGVKLAAKETRIFNETVDTTENRTNSTNGTQKVSAYNSETLIDDSGNENSGTDDLEGLKSRESTDETLDMQTAYDNLTLADKLHIINVAMSDVANFMKLDVY